MKLRPSTMYNFEKKMIAVQRIGEGFLSVTPIQIPRPTFKQHL